MSFSAPFLAWLAATQGTRCLLVEAAVKSGGVEITRYLSNRGYVTGPTDAPANQLYTGRIAGGVSFTRRLDLQGSGASLSFGDVELDNEDGALDAWLSDIWAARAISVYLGDASWPRASFEKVFGGTIDGVMPKGRNRLSLTVRDILGPLNSTFSTATVGGTADNKDATLPIALGECFNVAPELLDAATQKYGFLNQAIEGILETRDNGLVVPTTVTAASGYFTLTNARYGQITCDVQGAKVSGAYRNDAGGLIEWAATVLGDGNFLSAGQIDATALTAFRAACPQPVQRYVTDRANRLQIMQELAAAVGATVTATYDGKMILVRVGFGAPGAAIGPAQMVDGSFTPLSRPAVQGAIRLAGGRNYTPQSGALAGSVTSPQFPILGDEFITVAASDATTLADYKQSVSPPAVETLMVVEADISAEATRRLNLWKTPRTVFAFDGFAECFAHEIGDTITLTHPRFGLAAGATGQIIGVQHDWMTPRARLEVLV